MAAALGGGADDDFDQFDKPGAERSWRRRAGDDDWDSELDDDLLGEDLLTGKKNQSDLSDEELNDDLLQSDNEEEQEFRAQGVTVSLSATSGLLTSYELSETINDPSIEHESEYDHGEDEIGYDKSEAPEVYASEYAEEGHYEGNDPELTEDQIEYGEEPGEEDEVLDLEINEPLDEFPDEDYMQSYNEQAMEEQEEYTADEELEESQTMANESEEAAIESLELQEETKEESDEEEDDDEESGRLRFKTERKEGTIIRLSDVTRERRNIPETLVPLLPVPAQPRPAVGPQRFPGPPDFQQHTPGPVPTNFSQAPRLPIQDQWRGPPPPPPPLPPPPPQERDPFFIADPRFPSHHLFEQRSPPPPPPPPLLNSAHPVPTQSPMPFAQPAPAFNQQGQQPVFPRERPVRPNMQPQGPVGILHFNQPGSANPRPFIPPRQPFLQAPGQPFLTAPTMQGPLHPPLQPQPQPQPQQHHHQQQQQHHHQQQQQQQQHHHHLQGPPQPLMPMNQPQFRPHIQTTQQQPNNNRMQCQPRQGPMKPRHSTPSQNIVKRTNQQLQSTAPRNSNLRELPIAPSHAMEMSNNRRTSTPAAQVKPITSTMSATKSVAGVGNSQGRPEMKARTVTPVGQAKSEVKSEPEYPDEDEETRLYRLKIEEQKRLREEILKQKELRRQQQAGARKRELLERIAQQQQQQQPSTQQSYMQQEDDSSEYPTNGSPYIPHSGLQTRQNVKNRLLVKKQDSVIPDIQPKPTDFPQVGSNMQYQGQQMKPVKHLRQTRTVPPSQPQAPQKVLQTKPAAASPPTTQTARVASVQARPQELKPGVKRTVVQRTNSGSADGPHVGSKVRVIKLSGGQGGEDAGFFHPESQPQRPQQPLEPKQQPVRKVTLTKGMQQQQHQQQQQAQIHSPAPQGVKNIQGIHQPKKVIMHGRGRGVAGQMGRGRLMPNKQNLRVVECKPQPCIVSVEGLSSSTTDVQLKNLLMSVGPIQSLQMLPQQRKAIAKFKEPAHALAFQQKFHRHMIDLSHINVALIVE
ncbi:RNA-binding protein 33 isoform 7-T7 [Pterocles gutturalis]